MSRLSAILVVTTLLFSKAGAQTLVQSFNEPNAGEFEQVVELDTSAYTGGLPSATGQGVTWDFSNTKTRGAALTYSYVAALAVPEASLFASCDFVQKTGIFDGFFNSDTGEERTSLVGAFSNGITLTFTDPAVTMDYPISFGSQSDDLIAGTFILPPFSGVCAGTSKTEADGLGDLLLPGNISLQNVLRVRSVQQVGLLLNGLPAGSLELKTTYYYHSTEKFAVLTVTRTKLQLITGGETLTNICAVNTNVVPAAIAENSDNYIKIVPNPANEFLHIESGINISEVVIRDMTGRIVLRSADKIIPVGGLPQSVYSAEIIAGKKTLRRVKFLKI